MPEDNYLECMNAIAETMKGTKWKGEWYGKRGLFNIFYLFFLDINFFLKSIYSNSYIECDEINKVSHSVI